MIVTCDDPASNRTCWRLHCRSVVRSAASRRRLCPGRYAQGHQADVPASRQTILAMWGCCGARMKSKWVASFCTRVSVRPVEYLPWCTLRPAGSSGYSALLYSRTGPPSPPRGSSAGRSGRPPPSRGGAPGQRCCQQRASRATGATVGAQSAPPTSRAQCHNHRDALEQGPGAVGQPQHHEGPTRPTTATAGRRHDAAVSQGMIVTSGAFFGISGNPYVVEAWAVCPGPLIGVLQSSAGENTFAAVFSGPSCSEQNQPLVLW